MSSPKLEQAGKLTDITWSAYQHQRRVLTDWVPPPRRAAASISLRETPWPKTGAAYIRMFEPQRETRLAPRRCAT